MGPSRKKALVVLKSKKRVTFLICCHASRYWMLKHLLINQLKPAMNGVDFGTFPINCLANKKAWVTTTVFTEWFIKYFLPETRKYMNEKGLEFKVILFYI